MRALGLPQAKPAKNLLKFFKVLLVLVIAFGLAFCAYFGFGLEKPGTAFLGLFDFGHNYKPPKTPDTLYTLRGTSVLITGGNILTSNDQRKAIGIPMKLNLSPPFETISIDYQLRDTLFKQDSSRFVEASRRTVDSAQRDSIKKKIDGNIESNFPTKDAEQIQRIADDGFFISKYKGTFQKSPIFFLAGIPAKRDATPHSPLFVASQRKIISSAVEALCDSISKDDTVKHLLLPIIGTGAAGLDQLTAVDAMLGGINNAIISGKAPSSISLMFYVPDSIYSHPEKATPAQKAAWLEKGEALRIALDDASIDKRELIAWEYLRRRRWRFQLVVIVLAPLIARIIAGFFKSRLPVRLTLDYTAFVWIKWSIITGGLFSITGLQFQVNLPHPNSQFVLVCLGAIVMPLIEWFKIGQPNEHYCKWPGTLTSDQRNTSASSHSPATESPSTPPSPTPSIPKPSKT